MKPPVHRRAILATLLLAPLLPLRAQSSWPERSITVIVPFGPGGIADLTARTVAQAMSATLKVPIVIDNRPSDSITARTVRRGSQAFMQGFRSGFDTGRFCPLPL